MATASPALRAALLLGCLLVGCPAERLGVPVPPRGAQAIHQEDLQRDMFHLLEAGPAHRRHPDAVAWVTQRLDEMRLEPVEVSVEGVVCGLRQGRTEGVLLVLSQPAPFDASRAALPDAALISLAKSTDGLPEPRRSLLFCTSPQGGFQAFWNALPEPEAIVFIHRIGGELLEIESTEWEVPSTAVRTADAPTDSARAGMEELNYVRIAEHLRRVHQQLLAPEFTGTGS